VWIKTGIGLLKSQYKNWFEKVYSTFHIVFLFFFFFFFKKKKKKSSGTITKINSSITLYRVILEIQQETFTIRLYSMLKDKVSFSK
jgi:hypothetical protein